MSLVGHGALALFPLSSPSPIIRALKTRRSMSDTGGFFTRTSTNTRYYSAFLELSGTCLCGPMCLHIPSLLLFAFVISVLRFHPATPSSTLRVRDTKCWTRPNNSGRIGNFHGQPSSPGFCAATWHSRMDSQTPYPPFYSPSKQKQMHYQEGSWPIWEPSAS